MAVDTTVLLSSCMRKVGQPSRIDQVIRLNHGVSNKRWSKPRPKTYQSFRSSSAVDEEAIMQPPLQSASTLMPSKRMRVFSLGVSESPRTQLLPQGEPDVQTGLVGRGAYL
jgi:hypothetical protein